MNPYNELKATKGIFENRLKAINNGEQETRTYSESQYIAQVLRILGAYEKIILNGEFKVDITNELNDSIGVVGKKLKIAEIDDLLIIQAGTDNSYDLQNIAKALEQLSKEDALSGKNYLVIPKDAAVLTAKVVLDEEEEEEELWA